MQKEEAIELKRLSFEVAVVILDKRKGEQEASMEAECLRGDAIDGPLWQMHVLHEDTSPEVLSAFKRKLQTLMQSRNFPFVPSDRKSVV